MLYRHPIRAISGSTLYPGAELSVFAGGEDSENLAALFADLALTVPLPNPIAADAAGYYPAIYVAEGEYWARCGVDAEAFSAEAFGSPLSIDGQALADDAGRPIPNAVLTLYGSRTTALAAIY